jgi:chromosome segregation ATPase
VLARLLSSRVRDLEEQLRVEKRACEVHLHARAESAGQARRLTAECAEWTVQVVEMAAEARHRYAELQKLRVERDALVVSLEKARDIAAGLRADNHELQHELARLRPVGADPVAAPRGDRCEVERLRAEVSRLKLFAAAQENRLALAEGRQVQGTVVDHA